jgi:hypothetical protein
MEAFSTLSLVFGQPEKELAVNTHYKTESQLIIEHVAFNKLHRFYATHYIPCQYGNMSFV